MTERWASCAWTGAVVEVTWLAVVAVVAVVAVTDCVTDLVTAEAEVVATAFVAADAVRVTEWSTARVADPTTCRTAVAAGATATGADAAGEDAAGAEADVWAGADVETGDGAAG